jgi:hypothetical protein
MEVTAVEGGYSAVGKTAREDGDDEKKDYVQGGVEKTTVTVHPLFQNPYEVQVAEGKGSHGGGDSVLLRDCACRDTEDQFNRAA